MDLRTENGAAPPNPWPKWLSFATMGTAAASFLTISMLYNCRRCPMEACPLNCILRAVGFPTGALGRGGSQG